MREHDNWEAPSGVGRKNRGAYATWHRNEKAYQALIAAVDTGSLRSPSCQSPGMLQQTEGLTISSLFRPGFRPPAGQPA
jgi:hypothetical protein